MKIFIACSKYFYDRIIPIKEFLENGGHDITLPNSFDEPFAEERLKGISEGDHQKWKEDMMKRHSVTLKNLDAMLVLNFERKSIRV